jgi:hypothetical protein
MYRNLVIFVNVGGQIIMAIENLKRHMILAF